MALSIINGSNGNIAATIATNALTCFINYFSGDYVRDFTEQTTFCTAGWRSRQPGLKQLVGMLDGYLGKGVAGADPSIYIASATAQAYVLTNDTGCTYTFNGHAGRVHTGVRAALNSEFSLNYESDGQVTTAWVVA